MRGKSAQARVSWSYLLLMAEVSSSLALSYRSLSTEMTVPILCADSAAGLSEAGAGMVVPDGDGRSLTFFETTFNFSTRLQLWQDAGAGTPPTTTLATHDQPPAAFVAFVKPHLVEFPSLDGRHMIHGQYFATGVDGADGGTLGGAAAIFTHGGSQRQMYGALHYASVYANLYATCQQLALAGIPTLSINYRSGVGYGRDFRLCGPPLDPPNGPQTRRCGPRGALEYDDVRAGRAWLDKQLAPDRVGIFGLSYGGLNCLQALSRDPIDYAAGVCNAPVFNWVSQMRFDGATLFDPAPRLYPSYRQLPVGPEPLEAGPRWSARARNLSALAFASSPVAHVSSIRGPLLLIHGDLDEEVAYQESLDLARFLRAKGVPTDTLFFPDECHGECAYANQLVAMNATVSFLTSHLLHV